MNKSKDSATQELAISYKTYEEIAPFIEAEKQVRGTWVQQLGFEKEAS